MNASDEHRRENRSPTPSHRDFWWLGGGLAAALGLLVVAFAMATAPAGQAAEGWWQRDGEGHGFGRHHRDHRSPEGIRFSVAWMLRQVDASDEQVDAAAEIVQQAMGDLPDLHQTHDTLGNAARELLAADDYLPKPFNPRELLARLRAILRRGPIQNGAESDLLRFGDLEIDRGARLVRVEGRERPLTAHQFDLLCALAESAGRVMSRDALMNRLRGHELEAFDRSIDVHVSRIRAAIERDPKRPRRVITVRGAGYLFAARQDREGEP